MADSTNEAASAVATKDRSVSVPVASGRLDQEYEVLKPIGEQLPTVTWLARQS